MAYKGKYFHDNDHPMKGVHISMLACVIPGFGVSVYFKLGGIDKKTYKLFIDNNAMFIRDFIGDEQTEIYFINDNATIHKLMEESKDEEQYTMIFTIPYSPQTNGPVENFFGTTKSKFIRLGYVAQGNQANILNEVKERIINILKELRQCH